MRLDPKKPIASVRGTLPLRRSRDQGGAVIGPLVVGAVRARDVLLTAVPPPPAAVLPRKPVPEGCREHVGIISAIASRPERGLISVIQQSLTGQTLPTQSAGVSPVEGLRRR